jgi:hypothetical protein
MAALFAEERLYALRRTLTQGEHQPTEVKRRRDEWVGSVKSGKGSRKKEMKMKLMMYRWVLGGRIMKLWVAALISTALSLGIMAEAQSVSTTTVLGTVYLANGQPATGTVIVSWPAFTTASGAAVTADSTAVTIGSDGFLSANLAPNAGATPTGLYYTAVYHLSDGTTSTEYWVVPAAAQASLGSVRALLMPATQAVQAASKAYVDQAIAQVQSGQITATGGTLTGPLYLSGDPTQPQQAADKHYVDISVGQTVPLAGGTMTGTLTAPSIGIVNGADAEADATLMAGLTKSQQESLNYKDWNGNSQWAMIKDTSNNWALTSAVSGLDSLKAYQSTNSGDTYVNTSNSSGAVRINYESGSGTQFKIYGGNSSTLYAAFTGAQSIQFPGLAAAGGNNCLQIDSSGYITNTGNACGTVSSGTTGQIAYYSANGNAVAGTTTVPISAGGTGASTVAGALSTLNAQAAMPGVSSDGNNGIAVTGKIAASTVNVPGLIVPVTAYGAKCNWNGTTGTDDTAAFNAAWAAIASTGGEILLPSGSCYLPNGWNLSTSAIVTSNSAWTIEGQGASASVIVTKNANVGLDLGGVSNVHLKDFELYEVGTGNVGIARYRVLVNGSYQGGGSHTYENVLIYGSHNLAGLYSVASEVNRHSGLSIIETGTGAGFAIGNTNCLSMSGQGQTIYPNSNTVNHFVGGSILYYGSSSTGGAVLFCDGSQDDVSFTGTYFYSASPAYDVRFGQTATNNVQGSKAFHGSRFEGTADAISFNTGSAGPLTIDSGSTFGELSPGIDLDWISGSESVSTQGLYHADIHGNNHFGQGIYLQNVSDSKIWATTLYNLGGSFPATNINLQGLLSNSTVEGNTFTYGSSFVENGSVLIQNGSQDAVGNLHVFYGPYNPTASYAGYASNIVLKPFGTAPLSPYDGEIATADCVNWVPVGCVTGHEAVVKYNATLSAWEQLFTPSVFPTTISTNIIQASSGNAVTLYPGASPSYDLVVKNGALTANNLLLSDAGALTIAGSISGTVLNASSMVNTSTVNTTGWYMYQSGSTWYLRDMTNSVMTLGCAPGSGTTGVCTFYNQLSLTNGMYSATAGTGSLGSSTKWFNSAYLGTGTSYYTQLAPSGSQTGNVTLTIPTVTGSDNVMTTGTAQTVTGAKFHTGSASALTSVASTTSTSFASTGIVLPSVPVSTTAVGHCVVIWEGSSTSYTTTLGFGMNNAPTDLYVMNTAHTGASGATSADLYTTITGTTTTAISAAMTPSAASTGYKDEIDFTLVTGSSNAVTLTLYYESSSASGTSYVEPGSYCRWY